MEARVTTAPEPRTRPGMMSSLVFGTPGTPAVVGLFAEVEAEGVTLQVSRLDGETDWTVDAAFRGSMPIFANGFGARYLRTKVVAAEIAAVLTAAAPPPTPERCFGHQAYGHRCTDLCTATACPCRAEAPA